MCAQFVFEAVSTTRTCWISSCELFYIQRDASIRAMSITSTLRTSSAATRTRIDHIIVHALQSVLRRCSTSSWKIQSANPISISSFFQRAVCHFYSSSFQSFRVQQLPPQTVHALSAYSAWVLTTTYTVSGCCFCAEGLSDTSTTRYKDCAPRSLPQQETFATVSCTVAGLVFGRKF